jgi:predicted nucleotidyltransferase
MDLYNYNIILPLEIITEIILYLPIKDIINLININKNTKLLLDTDNTWKYIFKKKVLKKNKYININYDILKSYNYKNEFINIKKIYKIINELIKILLIQNSDILYIFGGILRDNILNNNPKDIDLLIVGNNNKRKKCVLLLDKYLNKHLSKFNNIIIHKKKLETNYSKNSKHIYKIDILTNYNYFIISIDIVYRHILKTNDWDYDVNTLILSYKNGWKLDTLIKNSNSNYLINIINNINNKIAYENPNMKYVSEKRKNKMIKNGFTIVYNNNICNTITNNKLNLLKTNF